MTALLHHKYWQMLAISWQAGFAYRAGVILWRLRVFLSTLMSLSIWQVIFVSRSQVLSYTGDQMTTYIFLVSILWSLILATDLHGLASQIYNGEMANSLTKPLNLYISLYMYDLADKLKNFFFVVLESGVLALLFHPVFSLPPIGILLLTIVWTLLAMVLNFIITLLFGCIGFWSNEVWAPKFLFFMIVDFTAGKLFPLDILPSAVQRVVSFTPFPFLSYYQTQLFLNKLPMSQLPALTLTLVGWCLGLGYITHRIWSRGMRDYEAVGR